MSQDLSQVPTEDLLKLLPEAELRRIAGIEQEPVETAPFQERAIAQMKGENPLASGVTEFGSEFRRAVGEQTTPEALIPLALGGAAGPILGKLGKIGGAYWRTGGKPGGLLSTLGRGSSKAALDVAEKSTTAVPASRTAEAVGKATDLGQLGGRPRLEILDALRAGGQTGGVGGAYEVPLGQMRRIGQVAGGLPKGRGKHIVGTLKGELEDVGSPEVQALLKALQDFQTRAHPLGGWGPTVKRLLPYAGAGAAGAGLSDFLRR